MKHRITLCSRRPVWWTGVIAVILVSIVVVQAASGQTAAEATVSGTPPGPQAAPADVSTYVLQRGDDIEIKAYNIAELDQAVRIRPDGKISLLLLDDVQAAGLTARQLADVLGRAFARHYRNPRISVIVRSFSTLSVYVGGEVLRPGLIPLRGDITALQAVLQAGGLKETSQASTVLLLRGLENGSTETTTLNVNAIISNKQPDVPLRPSDIVYVPKSNISVYVGGEVLHPGLLPLNGELTVMAAVFQAGGLKDSARRNSVVLVRNSGAGTPLVSKLRLDDVIKGKPDTVLQPFDIVYVPRSKIASIDRFVDQYIRQVLPINLAAGFSYILGASVLR
jgi:protein involved in polysaccharide export with SLBB domain